MNNTAFSLDMDEDILYIETDASMVGTRIDKVIMDYIAGLSPEDTKDWPSFSRTYIQKLIDDKRVKVNDNSVKSNYKIRLNDHISFIIPEPLELNIEAQNIPLDIVYEDEDIILVNKPKGMVVHPSAGHYRDTLVNALLYHCKDGLSGINGVMRPGIVHRIDKDTTGILVACKNDMAHLSLSEQLKEHSITRYYYAICHNAFRQANGTVDAPIGRHPTERKKMSINSKNGKNAVTHYEVLENFSQYAFIRCKLETGRTHQIRVHMTSISHPLVGDTMYGNVRSAFATQGQTLHAGVLGFVHPRTGQYMEFEAPLPEYFSEMLRKLRG